MRALPSSSCGLRYSLGAFMLCAIACAFVLMMLPTGTSADGRPIATPLDAWRPVEPGRWRLTSVISVGIGIPRETTRLVDACPWPSLLLLRYSGSEKLGKAGCRHDTVELPNRRYRVTTRCALLAGGESNETTVFEIVSDREFTAIGSFRESGRAVSINETATWVEPCQGEGPRP